MTQDLEQGKKPAENAAPPPPKEKVEAPSEETKEPTLVKTYTEAEFKKAQSSWDRQIALSKAEAKKAGAQTEQFKAEQKRSQAYIQSLKDEMVKLAESVEDPEVRKTYTSRIMALDRETSIAKRESDAEAKLYDAEQLAWSARMATKAAEVVKETGIDIKELEGCQTEDEIENKGLRFQIDNPKVEAKPEEKPQFDTGTSTPGGGTGFTMEQINKMPVKEFQEKEAEILQASREGKIK